MIKGVSSADSARDPVMNTAVKTSGVRTSRRHSSSSVLRLAGWMGGCVLRTATEGVDSGCCVGLGAIRDGDSSGGGSGNGNLVVNAGANATVTEGVTYSLSAQVSGGDGTYTYNWSASPSRPLHMKTPALLQRASSRR